MTESCCDSTPDFPADAFSRRLVRWYRCHQRRLPWRETRDPYAILVSEVMLQQTTVATVMGYYSRFLERFPTVADLAAAPTDEVLALWSGLGYYRRARNLQATARRIVAVHAGCVPHTLDELLSLPGVGRYTAGAVLSFAFGEPAPIVESNSARVLARVFAWRAPLKAPASVRQLWRFAHQLMPRSHQREHNYALMELGSLVCRPGLPDCSVCPVSSYCAAFVAGDQTSIPVADTPVARISVGFAAVVPLRADRVFMVRIPEGEWHAGLFEFPKMRLPSGRVLRDTRVAAKRLLRSLGLSGRLGCQEVFRYAVTRHRVTLHAFMAHCDEPAPVAGGDMCWVNLDEATKLPLGSVTRRMLEWVANEQQQGGSKG